MSKKPLPFPGADLKKYKDLTPFRLWCDGVINQYPFIENTFEALDNYGLLCKIVGYLNNVIVNENTVEENVANLALMFNNMVKYINEYFTNLDVQDEINKKLDEMSESGYFDSIFYNFIKVSRVYNTFQDLIADADNIVAGAKVKTLGYYDINDSGGGTYYIKLVGSEPTNQFYELLNTEKIAVLIVENSLINAKTLGARLDGVTDDTEKIANGLVYANIILPLKSIVMLNNLEIPSERSVDFNMSTVTTSSTAIKESDITETSGYNYRKGISVKNIIFDIPENCKGIHLVNTIESQFENIFINENMKSNSYCIYVNNCFNLVFKGINITGQFNYYNNNTYGLYFLGSEGGIRATYNLSNMKIEECFIQRVQYGITFDRTTIGEYDTFIANNIGFSWCDIAINVKDSLTYNRFRTSIIETAHIEFCNTGIYNNGWFSMKDILLYNTENGVINKGRLEFFGEFRITGDNVVNAITNTGNLDLQNCTLSASPTYTYDLGSNILPASAYNQIASKSRTLSELINHPEPINYDVLITTQTELFLGQFPETFNNRKVRIIHNKLPEEGTEEVIKVYTITGFYYQIHNHDYLEFNYKDGKWYILTSGTYVEI